MMSYAVLVADEAKVNLEKSTLYYKNISNILEKNFTDDVVKTIDYLVVINLELIVLYL